jgi:Zn-dependent protease
MSQIQQDLMRHLQAEQEAREIERARAAPPWSFARWGALGALLLLLWKFKAVLVIGLTKLKFILAGGKIFAMGKFLGTGVSMIISVFAYAFIFGLPYAVGFVLLIFVHEMGHVLALRWYGIQASVPIFLPFLGAFVAMKEMPKNAYVEAVVGIAGPVLGTVGALVCWQLYGWTQQPLFLALAYAGFMINLFNLMPVLPLDGGRVAAAISPWLWVAGMVACVLLMFARPNPILFILIILSLPRMWQMWRQPEAEREYYSVPPQQRTSMGIAYFVLCACLGAWMYQSHQTLQTLLKGQI